MAFGKVSQTETGRWILLFPGRDDSVRRFASLTEIFVGMSKLPTAAAWSLHNCPSQLTFSLDVPEPEHTLQFWIFAFLWLNDDGIVRTADHQNCLCITF